jgi:hypothetical protein
MSVGSVFWISITIIVVVSVLASALVKIIRGHPGSPKRFDELETDLATLEQDLLDARERIIVLEKIVTDQKYDLGKQIDDLAAN